MALYPGKLLEQYAAQYVTEKVSTQYTVANLPAAASNTGVRAFVTDATSPTFGSTVAGGGAVFTTVYSDGTNWIVG